MGRYFDKLTRAQMARFIYCLLVLTGVGSALGAGITSSVSGLIAGICIAFLASVMGVRVLPS